MADDIVTRLREPGFCGVAAQHEAADEIERLRAERDDWQREFHKAHSELGLAVDEIERLRVALALACNELFGTCDPLQTSPKQLMAHFLEEARRG